MFLITILLKVHISRKYKDQQKNFKKLASAVISIACSSTAIIYRDYSFINLIGRSNYV